MKHIILLTCVLTCSVVLWSGCIQANQLDQNWTSPIAVSSSIASLGGAVRLLKYQDTVIGVQSLGKGSAKLLFFNRSSNSWSEVPISDPKGYLWGYAAIDPQSKKILLPQGYMENDRLVMNVLVGRLMEGGVLRDTTEKQWTTDKEKLFGSASRNVRFTERNELGKRNWPNFGLGVMDGAELYIPYCLGGFTYNENGVAITRGPYIDGVFHSSDGGMTWQMEQVSNYDTFDPSVCRSKDHCYYFATGGMGVNSGWTLWFSQKQIGADSWDVPKLVTKTFASAYGHYVVATEGDTAHVCWMDRRHNKWRFNPEGPIIENNDIIYCHRKDSDSNWSNDVILSKGLLYSYAPSMSVEGNKIVVTLAGIRTADKWHTEYDPNDIYYVTSKDGGKTWTEPLKVTDGAKDGITSGKPQVMLLKGVIHIFYIQGKRESQELSPGLTKLNQSPWPIYYSQRPFPD